MGDPTPQSAGSASAEMLQTLRDHYLPALESINAGRLPSATSQANADAAASPIYAQTQQKLLEDYGPGMAAAGNAVNKVAGEGELANELSQIQGVGGDVAAASRALQEKVDPEYMKTRSLVASEIPGLLKSLGSGLSDTESEAIARGNARSGVNVGTSNMDNTKNAMNFGQAGHQRTMDFSNALAQASQLITPLGNAANRATVTPAANPGVAKLPSATTGAGADGFNFGQNMWGGLNSYQQMINSKRQNLMGQVGQGMEIGGKFVGGVASAII